MILPTEHPENLRDLSYIPLTGPYRIPPCRLIRCGTINGLSPEETLFLTRDLQIAQIIDFRSLDEVKKTPDDTMPGVTYTHINIFQNMQQQVPDIEHMAASLTSESLDEFMIQAYDHMISDPGAQQGYHEFLELLLKQETGATLFHCQAGKDRTGIGAAIILTILGASREAILDDYLQTNIQRKNGNERILQSLRQKGADEKFLSIIRTAFMVKPEYINHAFQKAGQLFGSFEEFILKGVRADSHLQEALRRMYLY